MSVDFMVAKQNGNTIGWVEGTEDLCLNVSNQSATMLLELIGITGYELIGTLTTKQVRQIVEQVDDLRLVKPAHTEQQPGKAKIIDCGMSLDRLRNYAHWLNKLADASEEYETYLISYA